MGDSNCNATRWTLVRRAQGRGEEGRAALSELCAIYYEPVLQFIRGRCGDPGRARDLAHGFFEDLLERGSLGAADPLKGRFRNYLFAAAKHYLSKLREKEAAAKRGGSQVFVLLDEAGLADDSQSSELEFDRAWALALIARALEGLGDEMEQAGKRDAFETLRPWLDGGTPGDPVAAGRRLELAPTALKVAIHRLRQRFRQRIRDEIASTIDNPAEADAEFRHLIDVWVMQR